MTAPYYILVFTKIFKLNHFITYQTRRVTPICLGQLGVFCFIFGEVPEIKRRRCPFPSREVPDVCILIKILNGFEKSDSNVADRTF